MTLKGKRPGCEHTSCAFRNVVHFFCSTLSPPTSLCGSGVGAQIFFFGGVERGVGIPARPNPCSDFGEEGGEGCRGPRSPQSSSHLADPGHPRHQEPLEEVKLVGGLLEEEVDFVVIGDAEGSHEGGVGCGARPGVRCLMRGVPQALPSALGIDGDVVGTLQDPAPRSPESQRRKASVLSSVRLPSEREMMGSLPWKLFMVPA